MRWRISRKILITRCIDPDSEFIPDAVFGF